MQRVAAEIAGLHGVWNLRFFNIKLLLKKYSLYVMTLWHPWSSIFIFLLFSGKTKLKHLNIDIKETTQSFLVAAIGICCCGPVTFVLDNSYRNTELEVFVSLNITLLDSRVF